MARMLTGKPVVEALAVGMREAIGDCEAQGVTPTLALLRLGESPSDMAYERTACKRAESLGVAVRSLALGADADEAEVADAISRVNADPSIHGCLMFRPLPSHLDEALLCELLAPEKDIDGITARSLAGVFAGGPGGFGPSTAEACLQVLDHYGITLAGKHVAVAGRSLVVGRPVAMMMLARDATVTLCHSRTPELERHLQAADIVVCATGKPRLFGPRCFREGQVVLDVGINFDEDGALCGDVDLASVEPVLGEQGAITPVPGGLGTVTTSVTLAHVVESALRSVEGGAPCPSTPLPR